MNQTDTNLQPGAKPAVSGSIEASGCVRCPCGKKVGEVSADGVEFWCERCRVPVEVSFARLKADGIMTAIGGINSAVSAISALAAMLPNLSASLNALQAA